MGITERLDESLVVLAILLDLELDDILYLSAKRNGYAFTGDGQGNFTCVRLAQKSITPKMREYFASQHWADANRLDYALYEMANRTLDATIHSIGETKFEQSLKQFRRKLHNAQTKCVSETRFPCTNGGKIDLNRSNCYTRDEGCGYACLDSTGKKTSNVIRHCIPSGSQDDINQALADGTLCQSRPLPGRHVQPHGSHRLFCG